MFFKALSDSDLEQMIKDIVAEQKSRRESKKRLMFSDARKAVGRFYYVQPTDDQGCWSKVVEFEEDEECLFVISIRMLSDGDWIYDQDAYVDIEDFFEEYKETTEEEWNSAKENMRDYFNNLFGFESKEDGCDKNQENE